MEREILKKGGGLLCERSELKFDFIRQQIKAFPVAILCRLMGSSRSGFYDYLKRLPIPPDQEERELEDATKSIFKVSGQASIGLRKPNGV